MLLFNSIKCKKLSLRNTILGIPDLKSANWFVYVRKGENALFLALRYAKGRESEPSAAGVCLVWRKDLDASSSRGSSAFFARDEKIADATFPHSPPPPPETRTKERERDRDIKREKKAHDLFWPTPRQWAQSLIFWPNQTDSPQNDFHATSTQLPTPLLKTTQITQMMFIIKKTG